MVFLACCIYLRCVKLLCVLPRGGHKVLQRNCDAPPGPSARKAGDPFSRPGELCLCPFRSFAQDAPAASFANGATTVAFPPPLRRAHANHAFLGHPVDLWARTAHTRLQKINMLPHCMRCWPSRACHDSHKLEHTRSNTPSPTVKKMLVGSSAIIK